ncbi:MAG: hypothetical protein RLZZ458_892 [Planctomycetota bacterium]|jgi:hypothetical protein
MQRRQLIRASLSVAAASLIPATLSSAAAPITPACDNPTLPLQLLQQLAAQLQKSTLSQNSPALLSESYALTTEVLQRLHATRPVSASLWQNLADSIARVQQFDQSVDREQLLLPLVAREITSLSC